MCKTIGDSIFSGSLSYLTGGLLLAAGEPEYIWAGAFILAVGTMQWVDAMIWYNKSQGASSVIWSQLGVPTVLVLELITGYFGYVYYSHKRIVLYEPLLAFMVLSILFTFYTNCDESSIDTSGYLIWCGKKNIKPQPYRIFERTLIMLCLVFPFFFYPHGIIKYGIILASFGLWVDTVMYDSFGSRWCHSFFAVDMIVLAKLLIQGA